MYRRQVIDVHFVGCGDAFGSGGRRQTCIAVSARENHVLIDCGASSLSGLKALGIDVGKIDTILISHLHGDHFGGIPFFLVEAEVTSRRRTRLTLAGPPGLAERVEQALDVFFPGSAEIGWSYPLDVVELPSSQPTEIDGLAVTAYPVTHFRGTEPHALRVEVEGRVISYSGDTGWTPSLVDVSAGADLFICEAYSFDRVMNEHLDYRTLVSHRAELSCKRIVLTHMSAELLERRHEVELEMAEDGMVITLEGAPS